MKISVNGIPLLNMEVTGQCASTYPFNHMLLESGFVSVRYEALPLHGSLKLNPGAYLGCRVELMDMDGSHVAPVSTLARYETPSQEEKALPLAAHEEFIYVSVPFSPVGWKNSVKLDRFRNQLRTMVYNKYMSIITLMRNHSFSQYESVFREREDRMAASFYLSQDAKRERMDDVEEAIRSCTGIVPLSARDFLEFAADGRLIRLVREDGDSSLRLWNEETQQEIILDLWLHMKPGSNELTVI